VNAVFADTFFYQDESLSEALTGDSHFEQAGFKSLLA
jgi:hypothetical protein